MQKSYLRSFAGGEIAPLLYGRLDLTKFQTGLAKCLNFVVTPQGPVENRPGFEYVLKAKAGAAVLIPFSYNSEQSFCLEFGDRYVRFHTNGATLLEGGRAILDISRASPGVFAVAGHGFSNGDWVYLYGITGASALNGRWGVVRNADANTFTLRDLFGNVIDTTAMGAYGSSGRVARVYELATPYLAADLFDLHYVQSADVLTIVHQDYPVHELRRLGATNWTLSTVGFVPAIGTPSAPTLTPGGPTTGTPKAETYLCTAIADGTLEESLASATASNATRDLTVPGAYIDVDPPTVAGAVRYNVYKLATGGIYGYIGQTAGAAFRDENYAPDTGVTPPLAYDPFAGENPRAVSYFEQRRVFGGGGLKPQNIQFTRSATESNMTYSIPTRDDDAITMRIVAREGHTVRHLVPLDDLLVFTSGGVFKVGGSGEMVTPTSGVKPHSYVGASNVQPVAATDSVLFAPARGNHIREVSYSWERQRYTAEDVAVLAPHLFDYRSIVQLAYSKSPTQVLWAVRDDGVLLGMTHQPEHEVKAWHQHATRGAFKSVCAVPEGDQDGVYALVARRVNGQDVHYIERLHSRQITSLADAFFVDSGLTYSGAARQVITGLWHLEGEEVVALADGGVEPAQTVRGGSITLQAPARKVHVGLAYSCDFQTVPLSLEASAAMGQGLNKSVNAWSLRVLQSSGVASGPSFTKLRDYPQRTASDAYGVAPAMVSGVIQMKLDPMWSQDGAVCVRQAAPLPLTILSLSPEVAT